MLSVIVMMNFAYRFSGCCHSDNKIVAMPTDKVQHCDYIRSNCKRFLSGFLANTAAIISEES